MEAAISQHVPSGARSLLDSDLQECPYGFYEELREQAPVYLDPKTGYYVVTRYEDVRRVLGDAATFSNDFQGEHRKRVQPERHGKIMALYESKGWVPEPTIGFRDDPDHAAMRKIFEKSLRAGRIRDLDPVIRDLAYRLIDDFIEDGHCDWVRQFAVPLPLMIICSQMGAPEEDIWTIKGWVDTFMKRHGMMMPEAEELAAVEQEIEAQHYFQPMFERLRRQPDDTLFSDLVNTVIEEWGRPLNDNELHAEMMTDTFVGGSETTKNALSAGVMLLVRQPEVWRALKADPDRHLRTFIEEVLRLESPVKGLYRLATREVEIAGCPIPAGSMVHVMFAAANRDGRHFDDPEMLDLERKNAGSHMAFSSGVHHCVGAPLARRELHWGFTALIDRVDDIWAAEGRNDFSHYPSIVIRELNELHVEFRAKA